MSEEQRSVKPWDLVNPNVMHVSDEVKKSRMDICLGCEHLIKFTKQCKKCGCLMHLKTKLAPASCPVGKWGAV
jgi:hypothetical protein